MMTDHTDYDLEVIEDDYTDYSDDDALTYDGFGPGPDGLTIFQMEKAFEQADRRQAAAALPTNGNGSAHLGNASHEEKSAESRAPPPLGTVERAQHFRNLADFYRRFGFNLLPLDENKHPALLGTINSYTGEPNRFKWKEYQSVKQTDDLWKEIRKPKWWTNVGGLGVIFGPASGTIAVVDVDSLRKRDPSAPGIDPAFFDSLLARLGLPATYAWHWQSPTGGRAILVNCPDLVLSKAKLDRPSPVAGVEHIELRFYSDSDTKGTYQALPGSIHPAGGLYEWVHGEPTEPPATIGADVLQRAYDAVTVADAPISPHGTQAARGVKTINHRGWAEGALADEVDQVRQAREGERNNTLNTAAFNVGQIVGAGALDRATVEHELLDAALAIGLEESEALRTITSGLEHGIAKPRDLSHVGNLNGNGYSGTDAENPEHNPEWEPGAEGETTRRKHSSWPYAVEDGRLVICKEGKEGVETRPIADFTARFDAILTDEDGNRTFTVAGVGKRSGAFRFDISANDFSSPQKLTPALTAATSGVDIIYPNMEKHLRAAIGNLSELQSIERIKLYTRTGWADGHFVMPGRTPEGATVQLHRDLAYCMGGGDLDSGMIALERFVESMGAAGLVVLSHALGAPLAKLAGWESHRYALFITGRTGSLKTSHAKIAMSIYGEGFGDDARLIKLGDGATKNALLHLSTQATDVPILFDNFKPNTRFDLVSLIHNIIEGGDRKRLDRASKLHATRDIFTWPIITGEDLPSDDAATLARMLVIRLKRDERDSTEALTAAQSRAGDLQAIGAVWLDWLESPEGQAAAAAAGKRTAETRDRWMKELSSKIQDGVNLRRLAQNLAINQIALEVAAEHPRLRLMLGGQLDNHRAYLGGLAVTTSAATSENTEAQRFLLALRQLLETRRAIMTAPVGKDLDYDFAIDPNSEKFHDVDRVIGQVESGQFYFYPDLTIRAVNTVLGRDLAVSKDALYGQLEHMGALASHEEGRGTHRTRIGGKTTRVLYLKEDAIFPPDDAEGGEDSDPCGSEVLDTMGL